MLFGIGVTLIFLFHMYVIRLRSQIMVVRGGGIRGGIENLRDSRGALESFDLPIGDLKIFWFPFTFCDSKVSKAIQ